MNITKFVVVVSGTSAHASELFRCTVNHKSWAQIKLTSAWTLVGPAWCRYPTAWHYSIVFGSSYDELAYSVITKNI